MSGDSQTFLIPQENDELFSTGRAIRWTLLVAIVVAGLLVATGAVSFVDNAWIQMVALWLVRLGAVSLLFLATVPGGYYAVELSFGAGRTTRVITKEGPSFRWPWMTIMRVDQRLVQYRDRLIYRAVLAKRVAVDYSVLFRASPDIRDKSDCNRFIESAMRDPTLRTVKNEIRQFLDIRFGWACRALTAEELLRSQPALELFGCCILKLCTPPHEDPDVIGARRLSDAEILGFYSMEAPNILARYGRHRLRPVLNMDFSAEERGRYRGEMLGADGRIADPQFHEKLSCVERYQGVEVMDFNAELSLSGPDQEVNQ